MTITNKGNYVVIDTGKEKYSIAKGAVIVTQSEDSVQLRLNGSRRVLVNIPYTEYAGATSAADLANKLIAILY